MGSVPTRAANFERLRSLIVEITHRLAEHVPQEMPLDLHGFNHLVTIVAEANKIRLSLDLPRMIEFRPVDDQRHRYSVKVWDPFCDGGKGIHCVISYFARSEFDVSTEKNVARTVGYLKRAIRYLDQKRTEQDSLDESTRITFDVAKTYNPLRSGDSSLWRTSLQSLRERFAEAARNQGRLTCVLTHSIIPEKPKQTDSLDLSAIAGMEPVAFGRGPCREPRQILSDDKPVAIQAGINRTYTVYADGPPEQQAAFYSAAAEAGRCLYGLPADVNRILWRDWLDGFTTIDDKAMWINALFELAWLRLPGSPLATEKFAWSGSASIPLDALPHFRQQAEHGGPMASITDIPDPPDWYSVLENLLSASVAAVDALLMIGDEAQAKQETDEQSEATTNQQVIEELERETPNLETESVEWLAARKENIEKLGLPLATLRTYRLVSNGGRKMPDEMFGIDRTGRRWRRQGTPQSMVYYYVPSLPKASKKASN